MLSEYDKGNGTCMYLKDNLCSIYDNRPDICRIDYMFEKIYKTIMTKDEYYKLNYKACRELITNKQ